MKSINFIRTWIFATQCNQIPFKQLRFAYLVRRPSQSIVPVESLQQIFLTYHFVTSKLAFSRQRSKSCKSLEIMRVRWPHEFGGHTSSVATHGPCFCLCFSVWSTKRLARNYCAAQPMYDLQPIKLALWNNLLGEQFCHLKADYS